MDQVIKVLLIFAAVVLMAAPLLWEAFVFSRDKSKGVSHKRFRVVVYTLIYTVAVTVLLAVMNELIGLIGDLPFVRSLSDAVSLGDRVEYCIALTVAVLINIAIGVLYIAVGMLVRIGMTKYELRIPKGNGRDFTKGQKRAQSIIKFFHTEVWFLVGRILKWLGIVLSVFYAAAFVFYMVFAVFGIGIIPYDVATVLFSSGYKYPIITLLLIWETFFFLSGIEDCPIEDCPELSNGKLKTKPIDDVTLDQIHETIRDQFGDCYACDVDLSKAVEQEVCNADHHEISVKIGRAAESDPRQPGEVRDAYLGCLDKLIGSDSSILINGSFFSGFSSCFLRYLSVIFARGDNVVFVCNSDLQIDSTYDYLVRGLSEISSIYMQGEKRGKLNFDDPIWRIAKVKNGEDDFFGDDISILVTSLTCLCSEQFERDHVRFVERLDSIVFVDTLATVNCCRRQLSILNTRLRHIVSKLGSEGAYKAGKVRYICFDDTGNAGLDRVLKNMLGVKLDSTDISHYDIRTLVRCYNYEGSLDKNGRRNCNQFLNTGEEIGVVMNVASACLLAGANCVAVFTDDSIPYEDYKETIAANDDERLRIDVDGYGICLNKPVYDPNGYSVIIAMDSGDNLPAAVRKYSAMVSDRAALIIIFSRPYMMRDYYTKNINDKWNDTSLAARIPVDGSTDRDIADQILIKANAGGISTAEIFEKAELLAKNNSDIKDCVRNSDLDKTLHYVLKLYGEDVPHNELYDIFEYNSSRRFDENGKYVSEVRVMLRREGRIFERINGRDMIKLIHGDSTVSLALPRSRMPQNYINGQNLIHDGRIYNIIETYVCQGRITAQLVIGGMNTNAWQYVQDRTYRVDLDPQEADIRHFELQRKEEGVSVTDIYLSSFRTPMEVITHGYFTVDPHTMATNDAEALYVRMDDDGNDDLSKQVYRRYGTFSGTEFEPKYRSDDIIARFAGGFYSGDKGARVMSVRICGSFGDHTDRTVYLAAVVINEVIHSMFPSVADSVAVCPVLGDKADLGNTPEAVLRMNPKAEVVFSNGKNDFVSTDDFNILIIEDCIDDLGVVSTLMASGEHVIREIFEPVFEYLTWVMSDNGKNDKYLQYGLDSAPECFDIGSLYKLAKLLGDDKHDIKVLPMSTIARDYVCDFCGQRYVKRDVNRLNDGRCMCANCSADVIQEHKDCEEHIRKAKKYLEDTYQISIKNVDKIIVPEKTEKVCNRIKKDPSNIGRGVRDVPLKAYHQPDKKLKKRRIHVEYTIPPNSLDELLIRQLTYAWQLEKLPNLPDDLAEGHIAWVAVKYLEDRRDIKTSLSQVRKHYYESAQNIAGEQYRLMVRRLSENPEYNNNPFKYLQDLYGEGKPSTTDTIDPADGRVKYFYYSRLPEEARPIYKVLLDKAQNFDEDPVEFNASLDDVTNIFNAVKYDHPELFWLGTIRQSSTGAKTKISPIFLATREEVDDDLQPKIDARVEDYLADINNDASDYDKLLQLHKKVIDNVDYDTLTLEQQQQVGNEGGIDCLRTICGVFLNGKAVCEGYARAIQYLLQKCGIECAEVVGNIIDESGQPGENNGHAWNIVKIDGEYYHLDVTWDDGTNTKADKQQAIDRMYGYFCVTTEEIERTRNFEGTPTELPQCTATEANYYYRNDLVVDDRGDVVNNVKKVIKKELDAKKSVVSFKCTTAELLEKVYEWVHKNLRNEFQEFSEGDSLQKNDQVRVVQIKRKQQP